jgi:hypothetical protein
VDQGRQVEAVKMAHMSCHRFTSHSRPGWSSPA